MISLGRLREVAEAATPGPWVRALSRSGRVVAPDAWGPTVVAECGAYNDDDAEHIATFDPPTVLALLDVAGLAGAPLNDARMKRALDRLREVTS